MLLNNRFQIYTDQIMDLAETVVIKSEYSAKGLNRLMAAKHGESAVSYDKRNWKYYKNISGEYYMPGVEDQLMYVVSLDQPEIPNPSGPGFIENKIVLNKTNLTQHTATKKAYQYGTRSYKELVERYPNQEQLILGILYPVDVDKAVNADDGDILGVPPGLIEFNEYTLLDDLQKWVKRYHIRWTNDSFTMTDPMYKATNLAQLYAALPSVIYNLRLERCKTKEAHSFHVFQYLASHGLNEYYLTFLTTKQAHWLYRNIRYIEIHSGHTDTFEWLIENILTERNLPIAEYRMKHNVGFMDNLDSINNVSNDYYTVSTDMVYETRVKAAGEQLLDPVIEYKRIPLNLGFNPDSREYATTIGLLTKENPLARDNPKYWLEEHLPKTEGKMQNSLSNTVKTKVLESSAVDYSGAAIHTLEEILLNHWGYLANRNIYNAYVTVTDPRTGTKMVLSAKEAFVFYTYVLCGSIGITLDEIPQWPALRVVREPKTSLAELRSVTNSKFIKAKLPQEMIQSLQAHYPQYVSYKTVLTNLGEYDGYSLLSPGQSIEYSDTGKQMLMGQLQIPVVVNDDFSQIVHDLQPALPIMISVNSFTDYCQKLYEAQLRHQLYIACYNHKDNRSIASLVVNKLFSDNILNIAESVNQTYTQWFNIRNIDASLYSRFHLQQLADDLLKESIGRDLFSKLSLRNLQKAMIDIMQRLSSYSVQFVTDINESGIKYLNWPAIRVGDVLGSDSVHGYLRTHVMGFGNYGGNSSQKTKLEIHSVLDIHETDLTRFQSQKEQLDPCMQVDLDGIARSTYTYTYNIPMYYYYTGDTANTSSQTMFAIGIENFNILTEDDKFRLTDMYCGCFAKPYQGIPLGELIVDNVLGVYETFDMENDVLPIFADIGYSDVDLDAFNNSYDNAFANGLDYISTNTDVPSFNYSAGTTVTDGQSLIGGNETLPGQEYTGEPNVTEGAEFVGNDQPLLGQEYISSTSPVDGQEYTGTSSDIEGQEYVGNNEDLLGQDYIGNQDITPGNEYTGNTDTLLGQDYTGEDFTGPGEEMSP